MKTVFFLILIAPLSFFNNSSVAEDLTVESIICASGYTIKVAGTKEEFENNDWWEYRIYKDGKILNDYFKDEKQCRVSISRSRGNLISQIFCNEDE